MSVAMSKGVRSAGRRSDPTVYPTEDDAGEGTLQRFISKLLRAQIARWLALRGQKAFVGANQFIYYVQYSPRNAVAPDVYVLPDVAPNADVESWKTWETGIVPSFACEVVSQDVAKDYFEAPRVYDQVGVRELLIFDPRHGDGKDRRRWQVFRRVGKRGLVNVEVSDGDRVRSNALGCWLRSVGDDAETRVRVATGPTGDQLVPTAEEDAARAREEAEAARAEAAAAREQVAAESGARRALEAELAKVRAELERLKRRR